MDKLTTQIAYFQVKFSNKTAFYVKRRTLNLLWWKKFVSNYFFYERILFEIIVNVVKLLENRDLSVKKEENRELKWLGRERFQLQP